MVTINFRDQPGPIGTNRVQSGLIGANWDQTGYMYNFPRFLKNSDFTHYEILSLTFSCISKIFIGTIVYISLTEDVPQKKIRDNSLKSSHPTPHAKDKTPSSQVGMLITFARSVKITLYFTKFIWVCQKIVI